MKRLFLLALLISLSKILLAQAGYDDSIYHFRQFYKEEFLKDDQSPLSAADTAFLRFYPPNKTFRVVARLQLSPSAITFQMPTHSGKMKPYKKYGVLSFILDNYPMTLEVYQSVDLIKQDEYKGYLFVPFTDLTNYVETYGGGRYLDLWVKDISNDSIVLDFNKAYNPYCAYAAGYSCPIPPDANRLPIAIKAGERTFAKKVEEWWGQCFHYLSI